VSLALWLTTLCLCPFIRANDTMVPDYQTLMLPLLRLVDDGSEYRVGDIIEPLAKQLGLTEEEKTEMLPSGRQASLSASSAVDLQLETEKTATPDEILRSTISDLETTLAQELLDRILAAPPVFFESLIVTLLLSMGYGGSREDAGRAIGKSGDGGIDGVIDQDPLGLDRVYLQAKRYRSDVPVTEPEVRAFSGSLGAAKANKGVFVTTSYFTKPAIEFAERHPFKMVLIDGAQLTTLMIRHSVGVRVAETLHLKKMDEDFFSDD
jgi:restriction system protein